MERGHPTHDLESMVALALLRQRSNTRTSRLIRESLAAGVDSVEALAEVAMTGLDAGAGSRSGHFAIQRRRASKLLVQAEKLGYAVIPVTDPRYPPWLYAVPDPPTVLWVKGEDESLGARAVAVVGSRNASPTACAVAQQLARGLAEAGIIVVSGLARGVDGWAHRGALEAGGKTFAVLGHGPDLVYPPEHRGLADDIGRSGALLSEFPPGTRPYPGNFPMRNRIISGLSRAVVVVEASERSGSLITARMALEQGREVLAVPGNVLSGCYKGCHALIKDGARLVETVEDILEELGWWQAGTPRLAPDSKSKETSWLLDSMPPGATAGIDELVARTGRPASVVLAGLGHLEVAGSVTREAAGTFRRLDEPGTNEMRREGTNSHE